MMTLTRGGRSGKVLCHPSGERWTVELRLDESDGAQGRQYSVFLNRLFATQMTASRAGEQLVADWEGGRVVVRDLILQELSAKYRSLRETHQRMQPPSVPTTRSAWERAIATWEERAWITAAEGARLRDHVVQTLAFEASDVRRHSFGGQAATSSTS